MQLGRLVVAFVGDWPAAVGEFLGLLTFEYKTNLISGLWQKSCYRKSTLTLLPFDSMIPRRSRNQIVLYSKVSKMTNRQFHDAVLREGRMPIEISALTLMPGCSISCHDLHTQDCVQCNR